MGYGQEKSMGYGLTDMGYGQHRLWTICVTDNMGYGQKILTVKEAATTSSASYTPEICLTGGLSSRCAHLIAVTSPPATPPLPHHLHLATPLF